jgi:hypothetical protein
MPIITKIAKMAKSGRQMNMGSMENQRKWIYLIFPKELSISRVPTCS